ncbi:zinc finger protein 467-like [Aphis craccivora]|uniref:Zinc finger protein 467-like n=1 Tax=Aphis craccivora TaxID=307492 RepID=A0A6G0VXS4_APHCR|nr:zinc finger protein 467-like [Aphis craccivora]
MFKCNKCISVFTAKRNLTAHQKNHDGVRFPRTVFSIVFRLQISPQQTFKNIHRVVQVPAYRINVASNGNRDNIQITPQIVVPDIPAGASELHAKKININRVVRIACRLLEGSVRIACRLLEGSVRIACHLLEGYIRINNLLFNWRIKVILVIKLVIIAFFASMKNYVTS